MTVAPEGRDALDRALDRATPPARAAAPRRLVGRRARVERDDDRAAPLLAPRPRPAHARLDRKIANELLARQRDDGTWSIWFEGPADLSTTVEAYAALKLAGVDPGEQTRDYIRREGGIPKTRIFTKCFLALLGQWPWQRIPPIPVELVLLPPTRAVLDLQLLLLGAAARSSRSRSCRALRPVRRRRDRPARDRRAAGEKPSRRTPGAAAPSARSRRPSAGCGSTRRPTAPGAGSSRRGSGRS